MRVADVHAELRERPERQEAREDAAEERADRGRRFVGAGFDGLGSGVVRLDWAGGVRAAAGGGRDWRFARVA